MSESPLISVKELEAKLSDDNLLILDVRASLTDPAEGRRLYEAGHIPGARFTDLENDVSGCRSGTNGRHPLPDSGRFCVNMRRLGLNPASRVVVYDQGDCNFAARLWFTLRWVGFKHVRGLDGGWATWEKAGMAVQTEEPAWEQGTYRATAPLERVFDDDFVEKNLAEHGPYVLVDARSHERFIGQNETMDPVAGHIPGALNRPSAENIGENGLFKAPEILKKEFEAVLAGRATENVINYCGSGGTACCNHLAMRVAGLRDAGVYVGSWSEWVADENRPVATGDN